jgi:hypothetical protein
VTPKRAPGLPPPFKFLASLRLAVFVILGIAAVAAVGTFTEARYDAEVAQKLVYQSVWMYLVMGLLCVNLTSVMIDRWPWKQHHAGFVLAHVGIMLLLLGALITQKLGVDGTLDFNIGEERRSLFLKDRELGVYSTLDGTSYTTLFQTDVDFLRHPPSPQSPYIIHLGSDELRVIGYEHFAFRESEINESPAAHDGPAVRFQLENANVNLTQWLRRENQRPSGEVDLGPAKVVLASEIMPPMGRNAVVLISHPDSPILDYIIYNKDNSIRKRGQVRQSETIDTGWMGMKFRLLRFMPHAKETVRFVASPTASPISVSALKFQFQGEEYWLGLDSVIKLYRDDRMFVVGYGHKQMQLDFPMRLLEFQMGRYEGTDRPSSYASVVHVPGQPQVTISMNEPLKYHGFTFYQSSFEKDPQTGKPTASILSVNRDPGRWIKYIGSMMIVLGSIVLFYFKRVQWLSTLKGKKE